MIFLNRIRLVKQYYFKLSNLFQLHDDSWKHEPRPGNLMIKDHCKIYNDHIF